MASFPDIQNNINKYLKNSKKIYESYTFFQNYVSEVIKVESTYIDSLNKLYNNIYGHELDRTFTDILNYLTESLKAKAIINITYTHSLQEEILKRLSLETRAISNSIEEISKIISIHEGDLPILYKNIEKFKLNYYTSARAFENKLVDAYINKEKYNKKGSLNLDELIFQVKNDEKIYLNELSKFNTKFSSYYPSIKQIITTSEKILIDSYVNLKKYVGLFYSKSIDYQNKLIQSLHFGNNLLKLIDLEKLKKINKTDFEIFLSKINKEFQFEPYKINILQNQSLNKDSANDIDLQSLTIIQTLKSTLYKVGKNFDEMEEKKKLNFLYLVDLALYGSANFSESESQTLMNFITGKENKFYRKKFLFSLNKLRNMGKLEMKKSLIKYVGTIFNSILNNFQNDQDYDIIKFIIILSQSYYYLENGQKIDLLDEILNNELFKSVDFFLNFLLDLIEKEIKDVNDQKVINNTCFSQCIAIVNNMFLFKVDKEKINDILKIVQEKYKVNNESMESIYELVKNTSYEEKKVEFKRSVRKKATALDLNSDQHVGKIFRKYSAENKKSEDIDKVKDKDSSNDEIYDKEDLKNLGNNELENNENENINFNTENGDKKKYSQ